MFEDKSYESILADMLARVPNTLDKRQGSIIWDALSPAAAELAQAYIDLDTVLNNAFADTATGTYLDMKCSEIGVTRIQASKTIQKGEFTGNGGFAFNVSIGSRFSIPNTQINFVVTEKISDGVFKMQCETAGSTGNTVTGQLIPITYIDGLETATLTEILILGEDTESDDNLRERYFNKAQNISKDGNSAQYIEWADEFAGIGNVKVFPLWNGANTIKISILNADNDIASSTLIDSFQDYLDPGSQGLGEGQAPIGAICTVSTASYKNIDIAANIVVASGYTLEQAITAASTAINAYFRQEISYLKSTVGIFAIGAVMLNVKEIESVSNITMNSGTVDITLGSEEIPYLNNLNLTTV